MSQFGRPAMINAGGTNGFTRPNPTMKTSFDLIRELLAVVTDPQPVWAVVQWRGTTGGYRFFGTDLNRNRAEKRAQLVSRIFPEYSKPKVTDDTYGM